MQDDEVASPPLMDEKKVASAAVSKVEKGSVEEMENMIEQSEL